VAYHSGAEFVTDNRLSSEDLAHLIVDGLLTAKLIQDEDVDRAVGIVAEEIDARKAVGDY
jgi:hypothetical protein